MKKLGIIIVSSALIVLTWCSPKPSVSQKQVREDTTTEVIYDGIHLQDKYIWSITTDQESTLSFQLPGKVLSILTQEWDIVKKWDILAVIDGNEIQVAVTSSDWMIRALRQLQWATSAMFDAQINTMKHKVQQAAIGKDSLQTSGNTVGNIQINTAEIWFLTNMVELDSTTQLLNQQEFSLYTNAQNAFAQTKVFLEPLGIFLDELFGISNLNYNKDDSYETYLWARDINTLNKTKIMWQDLNSKYSKLAPRLTELSQKTMNNPISKEEKQEIYDLLTGTQQFLLDTREMLKLSYKSVDMSLDDMRYFPMSKINELKNYINIYQANLEKVLLTVEWNYMLGIKWTIDSINTFNTQSDMQRTLLNKKVDIAKNQFSLAKEQITNQGSIAEEQYKEALEGMKALEKQKDAQIAQIESQIAQVWWQNSQASAQLQKTVLVAPYDWVILQKFIEQGEMTNPWAPVLSIGSQWQRKVVIQVSDKDIGNIQPQTIVQIYIPILQQTLSGQVTLIAPSANIFTRRRSVEIQFTEKQEDLPLWSQANILFPRNTIEWLKVPEQALQTLYGTTSIIKINEDGLLQQTPVQVIWCNNNACIVSGSNITAWDSVRIK